MLRCQIWGGRGLGELVGGGHPSERMQVRKEGLRSACPRCKVTPPIRHRVAGSNSASIGS
eukprot:1158041-Pelagomonas_calceolata.AAC.5